MKIKLFMLGGLLLLGMFLMSFFWEVHYIRMIFFFGGIIFLWIGTLFKDYNTEGIIHLNLNKISVKAGENLQLYNIFDLNDIKIFLAGVKGEAYPIRTIAFKQGSNNYIRFNYHEEEKVFQFLLEEPQVDLLLAVFEEWKKNGIEFAISNLTYKRFRTNEI